MSELDSIHLANIIGWMAFGVVAFCYIYSLLKGNNRDDEE